MSVAVKQMQVEFLARGLYEAHERANLLSGILGIKPWSHLDGLARRQWVAAAEYAAEYAATPREVER